MKKKFLVIGTVSALAIMILACGGKKDTDVVSFDDVDYEVQNDYDYEEQSDYDYEVSEDDSDDTVVASTLEEALSTPESQARLNQEIAVALDYFQGSYSNLEIKAHGNDLEYIFYFGVDYISSEDIDAAAESLNAMDIHEQVVSNKREYAAAYGIEPEHVILTYYTADGEFITSVSE